MSFTVINNDLLNDTRLDWRELGLLVYLLSKPDGWQVNAEHLSKERELGIKGIYSSLKILSSTGYVKKKPNPPPNGGWDWLVYDTPQNLDKSTECLLERMPSKANSLQGECHEGRMPSKANSLKGRQVNTEYLTNTDYSINTEITTTREGSILNDVQREIFIWASTHDYWHKATSSEEEFLKALCSPKGGMRRQFENRFKQQTGGSNAPSNKSSRAVQPDTSHFSNPSYYDSDTSTGFRTEFKPR